MSDLNQFARKEIRVTADTSIVENSCGKWAAKKTNAFRNLFNGDSFVSYRTARKRAKMMQEDIDNGYLKKN